MGQTVSTQEFATKSELAQYALKTDLTNPNEGYVKKNELGDRVSNLGIYVKTADLTGTLNNYYKKGDDIVIADDKTLSLGAFKLERRAGSGSGSGDLYVVSGNTGVKIYPN